MPRLFHRPGHLQLHLSISVKVGVGLYKRGPIKTYILQTGGLTIEVGLLTRHYGYVRNRLPFTSISFFAA